MVGRLLPPFAVDDGLRQMAARAGVSQILQTGVRTFLPVVAGLTQDAKRSLGRSNEDRILPNIGFSEYRQSIV